MFRLHACELPQIFAPSGLKIPVCDSNHQQNFFTLPQISILTGNARVSAGITKYDDHFASGARGRSLSIGVVPRLSMSNSAEIVGFWGRVKYMDEETSPIFLPQEASLPPQVPRGHWPGPYWAQDNSINDNGGVILRIAPEKWSLAAGVFRSTYSASSSFSNLFYEASANGNATHYVIAGPPSKAASTSGEVTLSREFGGSQLTSFFAWLLSMVECEARIRW